LVAGQDPALTPTINSAAKEMKITVVDDDAPTMISVEKVNFSGEEDKSIVFRVKLGAVPSDAMDRDGISVGYTVRKATETEVAPGAEIATFADDDETPEPEAPDLGASFLSDSLTGRLTFNSEGIATLSVPIADDDMVEFDEEFIFVISDADGSIPDPASMEMPPARLDMEVNPKQAMARGRILFNTNFVEHPMPAGSVDQSFNADNVRPLQLRRPGANGPVTAVTMDYVNTNYFVAGNFSAVNAITRHGLARLNSTGSVDLAFSPALNINGPVTSIDYYRTGPNLGKVIVGGGFSSVGGQPRNSIARYMPDGALDPNFQIGLGANGPIYAVKVEGDNSTIIAGAFTTFDGVPRGRIARLLPNGQLDPNSFTGAGADGPIFDLAVEIPQPPAARPIKPIS
jgi:hypothetical protein